MKKHTVLFSAGIFIVFFAMLTMSYANNRSENKNDHDAHDMAAASQEKVHDHGSHAMSSSSQEKAHDMKKGKMIRNVTMDGYQLMYHLIDMTSHTEQMEGVKSTHHLMVYIASSTGKPVAEARVGYLIKVDGKDPQKAMAMGMGGGFGADVGLGDTGTYTIKTKVAIGESSFIDSFEYTVE